MTALKTAISVTGSPGGGVSKVLKTVAVNWQAYALVLPPLVILIWFRYVPMYGIQIAFKDYDLLKGIGGSPWAGFKHFQELFETEKFWQVLANTLIINLYRLIFSFPLPILLAILIDECKHVRYKRFVQSVSYLPHFLSWVVISAIFMNLLSLDTGPVNKLISLLGGRQLMFTSDSRFFRSILVLTDVWQATGWSSIIYLAAITAIDPGLYEAAHMDGAGRLRRIWHVTLPCISGTIVTILILRAGKAVADNVEQVLMLYNPLVYDVGDVLGTYIYRMGIGQMRYSFTTAAGLFQSAVGFALMLGANTVAHRLGEPGLW